MKSIKVYSGYFLFLFVLSSFVLALPPLKNGKLTVKDWVKDGLTPKMDFTNKNIRKQLAKTYYVVMVRHPNGRYTFEVVRGIEYPNRVKSLREELKRATIRYRKEKKENPDKKLKAPKISIKVLHEFRKKELAQDLAKKYQEKWEKMQSKKKESQK